MSFFEKFSPLYSAEHKTSRLSLSISTLQFPRLIELSPPPPRPPFAAAHAISRRSFIGESDSDEKDFFDHGYNV